MEVRLLGPLEVRAGGVPVQVTSAKQRVVLAALALRVNEVVRTDELIRYLWAEHPPASARTTLHSLVLRLRKGLGAALITRPPGYVLELDPDHVDAHRYQRLREEADRAAAAGDTAGAAVLLREVLALWRGRALLDVDSEALRGRYDPVWADHYAETLERRISADLALGRHAQVVEELRALAAADPLREQLRALLVTALHRAGRRAEALSEYRDARRVLVDELGIEPGPDLRRAHLLVLRDDQEPEDEPAPPAPAGRPVPAQLPHDTRGFTGRHGELDRLDALLRARLGQPTGSDVLIVAVTGTAGVGKTAFAAHWSHRNRRHFPDGQLYADLRGFDSHQAPASPAEVLPRFLRALGADPRHLPADEHELTQLYRSQLTGRRVLVVLDNAASAEQVRPLLPGTPGCVVLVTSRRRLTGLVARDGAHAVDLGVLSPGESLDVLTAVVGPDRLAAEPEATERLLALCGHLPLAIRIAGANLTTQPRLSIGDMVGELRPDNRLAALAIEGDHETAVRAAFDQSYRALTPDGQLLFHRLALVTGPDTTAEAAAALLDAEAPEATALLRTLTETHLVEEHHTGRYRLHDLLKLYAAQRGAAEDDPATRRLARRRLYSSYLGTTDHAGGQLFPNVLRLPRPAGSGTGRTFADADAALRWLDAEHLNLLATVHDAVAAGEDELAWCQADALRGYFLYNDGGDRWLAALDVARDAARRHGQATAEGLMLQATGTHHSQRGAQSEAVPYLQQAIALHRTDGNLRAEANALNNLAATQYALGEARRAMEQYQQVARLYAQLGLRHGELLALSNLGRLHLALGTLPAAVDHFTRAIALARELGSETEEGLALGNLGHSYEKLGRLDEALRMLHTAAGIHHRLGIRVEEAEVHNSLSATYRAAGRHAEARTHVERALRLARDSHAAHWEATALNTRGSLHLEEGKPEAARADFLAAQVLADRLGHRPAEIQADIGLARVLTELGDPRGALTHARRAQLAARHTDSALQEGEAATAVGVALLALGDPVRAADEGRRAAALHATSGYALGAAEARRLLEEALPPAG